MPLPLTDAEKSDNTESTADAKQLDEKPHQQLDGGWRAWSAVFSAFLQACVSLGLPNSFGVYQSEYVLNTYQTSSTASITLIGSVNLMTLCAACFVGGRPCEIFGIRKTFLCGALCIVVGMLSASWCSSVGTLIVTQGLVSGFGGGLLFLTGSALPTQWFSTRKALAVGISASGSGAGGIAFSYITRALISSYGVSWSLRINAFICIGVLALAFVTMRIGSAKSRRAKSHEFVKVIKTMVAERWVVPFWIGFFLLMFGYQQPAFFLPSYIQSEGGASPAVGSSVAAVFNAGSIAGRIGLGLIADRYLGIMNTFLIFMSAAGVLQITMWLTATGNVITTFIFAFLYGLCGSGSLGISPTILARHLDPDSFAAIVGIFYTCEIPGYAGGSPLAGFTLEKGGYKALIGFSGGIQILGMGVVLASRFIMTRMVFIKT